MLAFGLALGVTLQHRFKEAAFLILTPLAAVVLGGPFLHIQQTVVAIPLGFMLLAKLPRRSFAFKGVVLAICLLAVPWRLLDTATMPAPLVAERVSYTTAQTRDVAPDISNEIPYADFLIAFERRPSRHSIRELIGRKLPTWSGLIMLLVVGCYTAYGPRRSAYARATTDSRAM